MGRQTLQHAALFEKCKSFTRAREIQAAGLYPYFKPISHSEDTVVMIEGKPRIMMGSNNYLGLTHHPDVLVAAKAALERYGSGCTGSRFLNGTLDLHERLEVELAEFFGKESCLVFSTGYQANLGLISGLVGRGDIALVRGEHVRRRGDERVGDRDDRARALGLGCPGDDPACCARRLGHASH